MIYHNFDAIYDENSLVLILGSIPSVKSRELNFYYAHPQNRFWKVLGILFDEEIVDKKDFLLEKHIALWDVIKSCEIKGSSDASIRNVSINDINSLVKRTKIKYIFTTGKKAYELYNKYLYEKVGIKAICLASPSPANCSCSLEELVKDYQKIVDVLNF